MAAETVKAVAAQKLAFEQLYSDGSGVQYAVRYDATLDLHTTDVIELESVATVRFPVDRLDWLIACLERIQCEVRCNKG